MADQEPPAATPGSSSTGPRLAHDLRAIREARNVSLDDVQRETRMPGDILRRFEAGELVNDQHYNEVYLRNLLRSYAQALGISPQEVSTAYEAAKAGTYDGALRRRYVEGKKASAPSETPPPVSAAPTAPKSAPTQTPKGTAPAVAALSTPPPKQPEAKKSAPARSSESLPKHRVQSASAASQPIEKSWGLIIGGTIAALAVIGFILWYLFRGTGPEPEIAELPPAPVDTTTAPAETQPEASVPVQQVPPGPQLQTPIRVTVIAVDEPLEDYKVQVDDDARRPYWLNPGTDQTFEGSNQVIIWGEAGEGDYDGSKLRLQGLEWSPREGTIYRIDRQRGQALLDSLHRAQFSGTAG